MWSSSLVIFLVFCLWQILCECPRKQAGEQEGDASSNGRAPSYEPPEQFIQSTFIHNSLTDEDREFSVVVMEKLRELRHKLKDVAKLTIDNENLDCNDHTYPKCREFPLKQSYHFLIVEDATNGAIVYSLDRAQNQAQVGLVENALLDAFSRHSSFGLMSYASAEAANLIGFVREVTVDELEKFLADNQNKRDAAEPTIFMRSPFELQLLNERIIEFRNAEADTTPLVGLRTFRAGELSELIDLDERRPVFVLFWTNVNVVSVHVHELWRRVVAKLYPLPEFKNKVIFGAVPCHVESDLCTAFSISHQDYRTVFVYRMSRKFASQFGIGDESFYINWIRTVVYGSPHKLESEEDFKQARRGLLTGFTGPASPQSFVTIGTFADEEQEEFLNFKKLSQMLYGRYHFVYYIQKGSSPSAFTIRPLEKTKRVDYKGKFGLNSLIAHVTQSSIPSLLNFSTGFTSDVVYRSSKPIVLLLHDDNQALLQEMSELATSADHKSRYYFAHIDKSYSLPVTSFLAEMQVNLADLPAIFELRKEEIRLVKRVKKGLSDVINKLNDKDVQVKKLERIKAHPLKHFQLEHINQVFGEQEVKLLPEPIIAPTFSHSQHSMDVGVAGGCPMMAHLSDTGRSHSERDEL